MALNPENFSKGFLIDEELMGGVTVDPGQAEQFVAFVLRHTTGEYLGYQPFAELNDALAAINQVKRDWIFEKAGGCGGCATGEGGCGGGKCGAGKCGQGQCPI